MPTTNSQENGKLARQQWMQTLACAQHGELADLLDQLPVQPDFEYLRQPESGLVMVRGRMGGTGDAFNMGEMTVTRCSIRTASGCIGHAYIAGREHRHAECAALLDAMLQDEAHSDAVGQIVLQPLQESARQRKLQRSTQVAATKVEFFTLVRGEDD